MANANEFVMPEFLANQSVTSLHKAIRDNIPDDIDCSEGSDLWDCTYGCAYVMAYICQYILPDAIKQIWPQFSYGDYALYHANTRNMTLKPAVNATGILRITGTAGTIIDEGSLFSTVSLNNSNAIRFSTTMEAVVDETGKVEVPIKAVVEGKSGNVPANCITLMVTKINGVTSVTNPERTADGADRETIASLIDRMVEYDSAQGSSYIGNDSDYIRWAKEVSGVGDASLIPAQPDEKGESNGIVTLIVVDVNGEPFSAGSQIFTDVYNHIMRPDNRTERLAPIEDNQLIVKSPDIKEITISAIVELDGTMTIENIESMYRSKLKSYFTQCMKEKEVKYTEVYSALNGIPGVNDFKNLVMTCEDLSANGIENIHIGEGSLAVLKTLNLQEGAV